MSLPILKIDDPLYACVASAPGRVGLVCTASSTVAPSQALLAAHAKGAGRDIAAESVLCAAAFDALASGRRDLHDRLVCEAAAELAPRVDRIVLAQASLAHLAEPLAAQLGLPVFASPELLVQEVVSRVRGFGLICPPRPKLPPPADGGLRPVVIARFFVSRVAAQEIGAASSERPLPARFARSGCPAWRRRRREEPPSSQAPV